MRSLHFAKRLIKSGKSNGNCVWNVYVVKRKILLQRLGNENFMCFFAINRNITTEYSQTMWLNNNLRFLFYWKSQMIWI